MTRIVHWERHIGRRLRLRDLFVFSTVARRGNMTRAAAELGVTTPTVSEIIADLEHALGVRLLDRSRKGVIPTASGQALLRRGEAAFDELRQGIAEIEFLSEPAAGEVKIGCPESIATILPPIVEPFRARYPRVVLDVTNVVFTTFAPRLRDRSLDLVLMRLRHSLVGDQAFDDINVDVLFDDDLVVVVGMRSPWARRRRIDLAELAHEQWILPPAPESWGYKTLANAFHVRGLGPPIISVNTLSIHLQLNLIASGQLITTMPRSVYRFYRERFELRRLPTTLPAPSWQVAILTLKDRTLSPVVQRFMEFTRETAARAIAPSRDSST